MKLSLRQLLFSASLLSFVPFIQAQQPLGLVVGDYNTPYAVSMNPAMVAGQHANRVYFNWWGTSLDVQSNFANSQGWKRRPGSLKMDQTWTPSTENQSWSLNYLNETYGPSLYVMPKGSVGFGLGVKGVSGFNFSGVNPTLGNVLQQGRNAWELTKGTTVSQNSLMAFNTEKYQEWYMSFGSYVGDADAKRGVRALKWGVTGKILVGMGAAHLSTSKLQAQYNGNNGFLIQDIMANYHYTDQTSATNTMVRPLGLKFDLMSGIGTGIDLGFMYEYRPGMSISYDGLSDCDRAIKRTYRWKFGASLNDVGFIQYDGSAYSVAATNASYTADSIFSIQQLYSSNESNLNHFDNMGAAATTLGANPKSSFTSYTPMALNVQWDYRWSKWHLGAYWTQNLKPVDMPGLRRTSSVSFVLRKQEENFEYGFPITVIQDYQQVNVGAFLRVGPLVVGSNNLAGLGSYLANAGTQGANFYIGFRSKIGDCSKTVYNNDDYNNTDTTAAEVVDSVVYPEPNDYNKRDTIVKRDTVIKRDTIVKTEIKTVVKRDTVIVTKTVNTTGNNVALQQSLNDCQKRETDLKNRLTAIEAREATVVNKNRNCEAELAKLKLESDKCKADLDRLKAENDRIKAENDRLRADNDRLRAVAIVPSDKQLKRCDSLLAAELLKNQKLQVELAESKKAASDCNLKLAEALNKAKTCETEAVKNKAVIEVLQADKKRLEDQLKSVSVGEDCTPYKNKIAELEKLLAAEKLKSAQLSNDLLNCNKSLETLKAQLAAEQAKTREAQAKSDACDKAKAALLAELDAAKKKVAELEDKLKLASTNSGADCSKTRDSLNQALLDLGIAKNAYDALMAEYQDCLKSAKSYKDQLKACEDKLAAGSSDATALDALKAEIAKLKITITELNGEVAAGKKSLEACQESIDEKDALIKSLQDQLKGKNADISTLQSQLKTAQTQITDLKARLAKCEEEKAAGSSTPTGTGGTGGVTPGGLTPGGGN